MYFVRYLCDKKVVIFLLYTEYWSDPSAFRVNELPDRTYFTPFPSKEECGRHRFESPYVFLLSGTWKFCFKDSVSKMKDFYKEDFDVSGFSDITVPGCWQMSGYDNIQYQSSPYTFIFDPPFVPKKNPAGAYVKEFDFIINNEKKYEIHFEGKDSCLYVWLNGHFIGYGQSPHNDSAFDITEYLKNGKNRLAVMVLKRCTGSYLDDQDKIRLSGLFRDIYILSRDKKCIRDFFIHTCTDGTVSVDITSDAPVVGILLDSEDKVLDTQEEKNSAINFKIKNPCLWTAETPYLYRLILCCGNEYISKKIGIREIAVTETALTVNSVPIRIHGVNRHDSSPEGGYTVTREHIERDLKMIKENNFNTVRTAHYTNMPEFYDLCDEIGLYVIAESDLECHGGIYPDEIHRIVDSPVFLDEICDRVHRSVEYLKNCSCVIMWSLANESSWGANLLEAAKRVKERDSSRPLHYEGINIPSRSGYTEDNKEARKYLDIYSRMYSSTTKLGAFYEEHKYNQPLIMCEYCHAMGNSCGDLKIYEDFFDNNPRFIGGCIWEWCDHAVARYSKSGRYFAYGGDFGDVHNLGNVCMDGIVNPDRVPHSALYEAKAVFAPIRFYPHGDDLHTVTVENRNSFISLGSYRFSYSITADGVVKEHGVFYSDTPPHSCENVTLDFDGGGYEGFVYLNLTAEDADGNTVAEAQFELYSKKHTEKTKRCELTVRKYEDKIRISNKNISYCFSTDIGTITSIKLNGAEMLAGTPEFICFRAPTDNDSYSKSEPMAQKWSMTKQFGNIEYIEHIMKNISVIESRNAVSIKGDLIVAVQGRAHISDGKIEFKFLSDGSMEIRHTGHFNKNLPYWLPRYGIMWKFKNRFSAIDYLGMGPHECYPDKCNHAMFGVYPYIPDDPCEMYEKPQEYGNRIHTKRLTAKASEGEGFGFYGDFSFSASSYDIHDKAMARHTSELRKKNLIYIFTDYFMSGVGSYALGGHTPDEQCRINAGDKIDFKLKFVPFGGEQKQAAGTDT